MKSFNDQNGEEHVFKKLLSYNKEDQENIFIALKVETAIKHWLPIASVEGGDLLGLYQNKIVYWNHDNDELIPVANTIQELFTKLY